MERIKLNKNEKRVLRELKRGRDGIPNGMNNYSFTDAVVTLTEKKLIQSKVDYEEVVAAKLTAKGYSYLSSNPSLLNPINWTAVAALGAWIAAIVGIIALFLACSHLAKL